MKQDITADTYRLPHGVAMTMVRYSGLWRGLHWLIAALVLVLFALGIAMVIRSDANLWDTLTNTLYAWHKGIGFIVLMLMLIRSFVRVFSKAPPPASLPPWQQWISRCLHIALYVLLLLIPLLGWAGASAYPALNLYADFALPRLPGIAASQALAREFFDIHSILAYLLLALLALHIAAALKHRLIDRDGVYERMSLTKKSDL